MLYVLSDDVLSFEDGERIRNFDLSENKLGGQGVDKRAGGDSLALDLQHSNCPSPKVLISQPAFKIFDIVMAWGGTSVHSGNIQTVW